MSTAAPTRCLALRLAGPLQSWGGRSIFNRRDTGPEPTKSGVIGLLAAARGMRRGDPLEDLLGLALGVRTDQAGSLLRDYHTVSDLRGVPLPSAAVSAKGVQKPTSPAKYTHVTERFYLQDAVFVAAVGGPETLLADLAEALRHPAFPLALGRRACPPTQPIVLASERPEGDLWSGTPLEVLGQVPWQAGHHRRRQLQRVRTRPRTLDLPVTVDDPHGEDVRVDLPSTFDPRDRSFTSRPVHQTWVRVPSPFPATAADDDDEPHDPFALLEW